MPEFEFETPFLISCIAKRGSGKSVLTKYLVRHWIGEGLFQEVFAFTNTNEVNNEYDYLKKKNILDRFDEKKLVKLMEIQKKAIKKYGKKSNKVKKILIIMDDIIGSLDKGSKALREIITQGRHYMISLILNIQISKKEISPEFKQNSDYFLVGYNNRSSYKALYDEFQFDGNLSQFCEFLHNNVTDHNFVLYINKVIDDPDIRKRYKIIKADTTDLDNFKLR